MVRTPGSHPGNRGSIPLGAAIFKMKKITVIAALFLIVPFFSAFSAVKLFPNPWIPSLGGGHSYVITLSGITDKMTEIDIYNINGTLIKTILDVQNNKILNTINSEYYIDWNGQSSSGMPLASGVYIYTIKDLSGQVTDVGKFAVIK